MSISSRILQLREALGLNQNELAVKTGLGLSSISNWENGRYEPSNATLRQLADGTGASYDWLRTGKGEMLVGNLPRRNQATDETPTRESSKPRIDAAGVGGYNAGSVRTITIDPGEDMTYKPSCVVPMLLSASAAVLNRDDLERARVLEEMGKRFRVRLTIEEYDPRTNEEPPPAKG